MMTTLIMIINQWWMVLYRWSGWESGWKRRWWKVMQKIRRSRRRSALNNNDNGAMIPRSSSLHYLGSYCHHFCYTLYINNIISNIIINNYYYCIIICNYWTQALLFSLSTPCRHPTMVITARVCTTLLIVTPPFACRLKDIREFHANFLPASLLYANLNAVVSIETEGAYNNNISATIDLYQHLSCCLNHWR